MKRIFSIAMVALLVFSTLSVLSIVTVSAAVDEYFIYSKFDPPGISDVVGVGGYVEYYGVPEWGDEIQYVYFLSGNTGYKVKVWVIDGDGDGKIEPRQHPSHYLSEYQGPIEPRHFQIVSSKDLTGYTGGSGWHTEEFYIDSSGVYLGAYPYGIHKWDHDWNYIEKIANHPPTRTESMAYNPAENVWYAGGRYRTIYQLSDTDNDGSFLDESWVAIFTYPSYGGSHHDGMEYVGGYLWISDMTSDVIGKWQYNPATSSWEELKRFTYTEPASVEGVGFGPNDHFWCGSGWGSGSYIYELGNEITLGYPIADAGPDVDAHPPTIPVKFDASGSHHTDPAKQIVLYEWDFESDGTWDYSFGRFVYPTGKKPTIYPPYVYEYGGGEAKTYYLFAGGHYAGWLARGDKGHYVGGKYHIGQDIEGKKGDPVYAIADGNIVYVHTGNGDWGWDQRVGGKENFGYFVEHVANGETFLALYGHVKPTLPELIEAPEGKLADPIPIYAGQSFAKLDEIWYQTEDGADRKSIQAHLHFGIRPQPYNIPPDSPWGALPITNDNWPDENKPPKTNGFEDPIEWITTRTPLKPVPLYVEHAYPAYYNPDGSIDWDKTAKDYTATLRVTDNSDPPLQDTDTRIVHITSPPWKPVADPDGPYEGYVKAPVQLDGSKSYDPESKMFPPDHPWYETIAKYEWDLDYDGEFDDSTDVKPSWTWNSEGLYIVGFKVTDSQPSGPGGTIGPLDFDIKYTTVVISKPLLNIGIIFLKYSDNDPAPTRTITDFEKIKNDFLNYYSEVSYGRISFDVKFYDNDGSWFTLPHTIKYYLGFKTLSERVNAFIQDALSVSDEKVDYTLYDYDSDRGRGVPIFIPSGSLKRWGIRGVFSHETSMEGGYPTNDGTKVDGIIISELENVGVWAHEVGHALGKLLVTSIIGEKDWLWALPDLYEKAPSQTNRGYIGDWGLMGDGCALPRDWLGFGTYTHPDHMSSYSKEWLGWLKYREYQHPSYGTYWINSLVTMKYEDDVFKYKINDNMYYILEVHNKDSRYSNWDTTAPTPWLHDSAEVIYKVERKTIWIDYLKAHKTVWIVNVVGKPLVLSPIPIVQSDYYSDDANKVMFKVVDEIWGTKYEMKTEIKKPSIWNKLGAVLDPGAQLISSIPKAITGIPFEFEYTLPDLDLHAYSSDGKHVGMNYDTGEYEMEIPNATASGDLWNGQEWIFVPEDVNVHFVVSANDNKAFFNAFPEAWEVSDGVETFDLNLIYYDSEGNRWESTQITEQIEPGEALWYPYDVTQNPDGTYSITVGEGQSLTTVTNWMTDSDFNNITSFRAVFTPDRKTGYYKLTATNPGQFYQNILVNNTGPIPLNITIMYDIDANFTTKGTMPIHVYADLERTIDLTPPPSGKDPTNITISDNNITAYYVQPGDIIYITIHLDYALKGTKWTKSQVEAWYSEHTFNATAETDISSIKSSVTITDPETMIPPEPVYFVFLIVVFPSVFMFFGLLILEKYGPLTTRRRKEN